MATEGGRTSDGAATGRPRSLQARLLALVLGLVAAVWLAAVTAAALDVQHELGELLDGHLAQAASMLLVQGDGDNDEDDIVDAPILHKYAPQVAFQVFVGGQLLMRSSNVGEAPLAAPGSGFSTVEQPDGTRWRVFATQESIEDKAVFVAERIEARRSILWAVLHNLAWPLLVGLPVLALAGWWSVRRGLMPLRALSAALAQRAPQALEPMSTHDQPQELRPLVEALNALLERIAGMVQLERRFTADAAHELRTPIAAIRTQAQVALGASDAAERTHALRTTLAGCDRATRLVEQLLTLARLESAAEQTSTVDLAPLARRVLGELAPAALERGQQLELLCDGPCRVMGEDVLLGVLLRNLVDNALRYSPSGASVRVALEPPVAGQVEARLVVEDSGPGMQAADLDRLGERFFRVLGTGQSGSGLGWSIVQRIAAVAGAAVTVDRSPTLGGLRVAVRWPGGGAAAHS